MSRLRRNFDREFRDGAVRVVSETGRPVAYVAREFGVCEGTLGSWVRQGRAERGGGLTSDGTRCRCRTRRLRRRWPARGVEIGV